MTQPLSHGVATANFHRSLCLNIPSDTYITDGVHARRRLILSAMFVVLVVVSEVQMSSLRLV